MRNDEGRDVSIGEDALLIIEGSISFLRENRAAVLWILLVSFLITITAFFVVPRRYASTATILPSMPDSHGLIDEDNSLLGLGLNAGIAENTDPLTLYPEILRSRLIGLDVLKKKYRFHADGKVVERTLREYLGKRNDDAALAYLNSAVASFWVIPKAQTLALRITTGNPELSAEIANAYIERLERYNLNERRTISKEVYSFIEKKLAASREELSEAENALKKFRERNREYAFSSDPVIQMEHRRLMRRVQLKSALYLELAKQLKKAALEVEKNTPILNVLDRGIRSSRPVWPRPLEFIVSFTLLGFFVGLLCLYLVLKYRKWRMSEAGRVIDALLDELRSDTGRTRLHNEVGVEQG